MRRNLNYLIRKILISSTFLFLLFGNSIHGGTGGYQKDFPTYVLPDDSKVESIANEDRTDALLLDSILSIIQTYYVDFKRINPRNLYTQTIAALDFDPLIKVETRGRTQIAIMTDVDEFVANIETPYTYDGYLKFLLSLKKGLKSVFRRTEEEPIIYLSNLLLKSLDAHSSLLSAEDYKELRQGTEGTFGGLGILVGIRDELLTVIKPLPNSPALRNGIQRNDKIIRINGLDTFGFTLDHLVEHMRGAPGTQVELEILAEEDFGPKKMTMRREVIKVESVFAHEMITKQGAVLRLIVESFSSRTTREIVEKMTQFHKKYGDRNLGLILDLRSNPGGLLDQAVQVSDLFLESGVIVSTKGRRQEIEKADRGYDELENPIMVLIDEDSASASEIVAGALQDHGRGIVIGQQSYGKGSVQTVFELPGQRALKLTIARYYTPSGTSIQNVGIKPDIFLQPINQNELNHNILGEHRYKSEEFLHNHLNAKNLDSSDTGYSHVEVGNRMNFSGSYLKTPALPPLDERTSDTEIELAKSLLVELRKMKDDEDRVFQNRSSYWLSSLGPYVNRHINGLQMKVQKYLKEEHDVDWLGKNSVVDTKLKFELKGKSTHQWFPGKKVSIDYKIENLSDGEATNLSVFVRSDDPDFPTLEVLIDKLHPKETRTDTLVYDVPTYKSPGKVFYEIGLSKNGKAVPLSIVRTQANILRRQKGVLSALGRVENERGAIKNRKLEPSEKADLVVNLKNIGSIDVKNLEVKLINIAGKQVNLPKVSQKIGFIGKNNSKEIKFAISGSNKIFSDDLQVGLVVSSKDLKWPHKEIIGLRGAPVKTKLNQSSTSH